MLVTCLNIVYGGGVKKQKKKQLPLAVLIRIKYVK